MTSEQQVALAEDATDRAHTTCESGSASITGRLTIRPSTTAPVRAPCAPICSGSPARCESMTPARSTFTSAPCRVGSSGQVVEELCDTPATCLMTASWPGSSQQAAREQRAQEQGAGYEFVLDGEGYYFNCLCLALGEVYETAEHNSPPAPSDPFRKGEQSSAKHAV